MRRLHPSISAITPVSYRAESLVCRFVPGLLITNVIAPFMAPYVIGKAALDALAENTAYEISQFGVETPF